MIQSIRQLYGNLSLRVKMMISMMVVVVFIVLTLSVLNMNSLSTSMTQVTNEHIYQVIEQVKVRIESYLSFGEKIIRFMDDSSVMKEYLQAQDQQSLGILTEKVRAQLKSFGDNEPNMNGILFLSTNDELISPNMERVEDTSLLNESWYVEAMKEPDAIHLYSQPIGRNIQSIYEFNHADNIISMVRAVKDEANRVRGVLLIDMRLDAIEMIINSVSLGKSGFLYVAS